MARFALVALLAATPAAVQAQAYQCAAPTSIERPHPDLPSDSQPRRLLPIGGYTLAITWAPQYCRDHDRDGGARFQCAAGNRFGFTLHGLWPDGIGKDWPQYCRSTGLIPQGVIRGGLCATPSAQLMQHEWAKHGTCMAGESPASYFRRSGQLFARLRYPDMDALSRQPLTAARLASAIADANPGMTPAMMRITADRQGWLDEVWLCLDKAFGHARCPAHQGGLTPGATVKIWRGRQ